VSEVNCAGGGTATAEPASGSPESYYWMSGQYDGAAIASLLDSQAHRLQRTVGPAGR
jgi:hypothetical protein